MIDPRHERFLTAICARTIKHSGRDFYTHLKAPASCWRWGNRSRSVARDCSTALWHGIFAVGRFLSTRDHPRPDRRAREHRLRVMSPPGRRRFWAILPAATSCSTTICERRDHAHSGTSPAPRNRSQSHRAGRKVRAMLQQLRRHAHQRGRQRRHRPMALIRRPADSRPVGKGQGSAPPGDGRFGAFPLRNTARLIESVRPSRAQTSWSTTNMWRSRPTLGLLESDRDWS